MAIFPAETAVSCTPTDQHEAFCGAYVYHGNAARRVGSVEPSDCGEADTLLGKLENAYNQALEDQAYHAASRTVEIQERLARLMPSQPERLHLIKGKPDETAETG